LKIGELVLKNSSFFWWENYDFVSNSTNNSSTLNNNYTNINNLSVYPSIIETNIINLVSVKASNLLFKNIGFLKVLNVINNNNNN
jgi:hypothetical protein